MNLRRSTSAVLLAASLAWAAQAQSQGTGGAAEPLLTPPGASPPGPVVVPRITPPLVKPKPLTVDPPPLQRGQPAPLGGYDDATRRCEALGDVLQRSQCHDRLTRETPARPPAGTPLN